MAHDHRTDDQESLFPSDDGKEQEEQRDDRSDLSSQEERLRNGDISFRPVSLPGSPQEPAASRGGSGGTALMIVAAIIVVFLLTYVIYTFYSPSHSGQEEAATEPAGVPAVEEEASTSDRERERLPEEPTAMFQAHSELQEKFRLSEVRIAELEAEIRTLSEASPAPVPAGGSAAVDQNRLDRLEEENRTLKAGLEQQRRESESAVSKAERLVERAEAQVTEERGKTRTARQDAETLAGEKAALTGELDTLKEQVAELEAELARRNEEYEMLTANATTRLEGESEAVRQLISRHATELERERQATREKEAEIRRLNGLIARLSVEETGSGRQASSSPPAGSSSTGSAGATDALTPPRILTRSAPEYP